MKHRKTRKKNRTNIFFSSFLLVGFGFAGCNDVKHLNHFSVDSKVLLNSLVPQLMPYFDFLIQLHDFPGT